MTLITITVGQSWGAESPRTDANSTGGEGIHSHSCELLCQPRVVRGCLYLLHQCPQPSDHLGWGVARLEMGTGVPPTIFNHKDHALGQNLGDPPDMFLPKGSALRREPLM